MERLKKLDLSLEPLVNGLQPSASLIDELNRSAIDEATLTDTQRSALYTTQKRMDILEQLTEQMRHVLSCLCPVCNKPMLDCLCTDEDLDRFIQTVEVRYEPTRLFTRPSR